MRLRRVAPWAATAALLAAGVAVATPATALGSAVVGDFVCETSASSHGVAGVVLGEPVQYRSTVTAPTTAPQDSAVVADVVVEPVAGGTAPLSPPVDLADVTVSQVQVRLDVFVTTTNSPTGITGDPEPAPGAAVVDDGPFDQPASTPWGTPVEVSVSVPTTGHDVGDRLWLRVKEFSYIWSSTEDDLAGATTCRLVGPIPPAYSGQAGATTVEEPLYGALSAQSRQYTESYSNFTASDPATFGSFGSRVTVAAAPPTTGTDDECTVPEGGECDTEQEVEVTVDPGNLMQSAAVTGDNPSATQVILTDEVSGDPYITVDAFSQTMVGPMNTVTVTDLRGSADGWSLTAALADDFTAVTGGTITKDKVALTGVGCAPVPGSATRITGSGGNLSNPAVTLCKVEPGVDDSSGDSGSGQYAVSAQLELEVPAFQRAGEYTSTLTITLT